MTIEGKGREAKEANRGLSKVLGIFPYNSLDLTVKTDWALL